MIKRYLFLCTVLLLQGCSVIQKDIGADFNQTLGALLAAGGPQSVDDVLTLMGPPQAVAAAGTGYTFLYQYIYIEEKQLGISSKSPVLRWFKISLADADSTSSIAMAHFDHDNALVAVGTAQVDSDLGDAGSLMFALNFLPMVDSAALEQDLWGPTRWGYSLLQPANVLLNRDSSPDSGSAALEQRGTPTNAGQRTLEYRR